MSKIIKDAKLSDKVFKIEPNDVVLKNAIVLSMASMRQGTADTKTRSEVRGGGRKPWKQKGTGNARQGSIRATQWRGGGIVFGPTPRDYSKKQNKKERRLALLSALTYKNTDNEIIVVDEIKFDDVKTKNMTSLLEELNIADKKVLVVVEELTDNVCLSARNLRNVKVITNDEVCTLDVVSCDYMVITEKALNKLEEVLG